MLKDPAQAWGQCYTTLLIDHCDRVMQNKLECQKDAKITQKRLRSCTGKSTIKNFLCY